MADAPSIPDDIDDLDWPGLLLYLLDDKGLSLVDALRYVQNLQTMLHALQRLGNPQRTAEAIESDPHVFAQLGVIRLH